MNDNTDHPRRVLVTGSAGAIGRPVCRRLRERGHQVRGFDRRPTDGLDDTVVADLCDRVALQTAVAGMDTIIHMAAFPDDGDFVEDLLGPNVQGVYHVCDAARANGVERLVLASSLQVVAGHGWGGRTIRVEDGPAPTNHYGLAKAWAEAMGEMYARCHGLSVVCARIGWFPRDTRDARRLAGHEIGPAVFFSHNDAGRFFERCVESPAPAPAECAIVFATSRPPGHALLDLEPGRRVLGYEPRDTWPAGLPFAAP